MELQKRTWCYVQPPMNYEIAPCSCGNIHTQWSEYQKHIWCDPCQKDFIPEHNGIFDGPIGLGVAKLLGISFARIQFESKDIEDLDSNGNYVKCLKTKEVFSEKKIPLQILYYRSGTVPTGLIKEGILDISDSKYNVTVTEPIADDSNLHFTVEVKFIDSSIRTFKLILELNEDKKSFKIKPNKEFETFLLVNNLDTDLPINKISSKPNKI